MLEINIEAYLKKKKKKKREYGKNRYHNMSEEKKQKLKKYQKNYCGAKMSQYNNEQNSFLIFDLIVYAVI